MRADPALPGRLALFSALIWLRPRNLGIVKTNSFRGQSARRGRPLARRL